VNINNDKVCDDEDPCTENDVCNGGVCAGSVIELDDGDKCTIDFCDPIEGPLHPQKECGDGMPCTIDWCNSVTGWCENTNKDCSDAVLDPVTGAVLAGDNLCTNNLCNPNSGECFNPDITCHDDDVCTSDSCNPEIGCVFEMIVPCCGNGQVDGGEQCDDGNQQSGDGCSDACVFEKFIFQASQTIDGKTVTCSSTTTNASYTQCNDLKAGGMYFPNGVECGPLWSSTNSSYSDTKGFCASLTGNSTIQVYYACTNTQTRAAWHNHVWGTSEDNGYTQHVRCFY
jgi:cysteine-rich repeat protein